MNQMKNTQFITSLVISISVLTTVGISQDALPNPATTPSARPDAWWQQRQQDLNARIAEGNVDLIFIGDSITQGWEGAANVWNKYYGKRNAVNLGIIGDETSHVLWRLDHGNIDRISPKLAVLMIGTNNAGNAHHSSEAIASGVQAVVKKVQAKLPQTKILLLAIFPRGTDNNDRLRKVNEKTNAIIAKLANNRTVFYLDIGPSFLSFDGTLDKDIMPDLLHPNAKGYTIWAEAMEPTLAKLMGE